MQVSEWLLMRHQLMAHLRSLCKARLYAMRHAASGILTVYFFMLVILISRMIEVHEQK
jgi:hypothetical protein